MLSDATSPLYWRGGTANGDFRPPEKTHCVHNAVQFEGECSRLPAVSVAANALVLDFDGTILDTEWPHFMAVQDLFKRHGLDLTLEQWQHRVGAHPDLHWFDWLKSLVDYPVDEDERRHARRLKTAATLAEPVRPGVMTVLTNARAAGWKTAVASSSPTDWVEGHLVRLNVLPFIDEIRTRDHVQQTKPAPDVFLAAARALAVPPESCLAIEDSRNGVLAAKAAGMSCVAVPNRVTSSHDLSEADRVVDSLADLDLADWKR